MKVYAVFIRCSAPGYGCRWIDSQWAALKAADDRMSELNAVMVGFGATHHTTAIVEMEVADVAIVSPVAPVKAETGSHKKKAV